MTRKVLLAAWLLWTGVPATQANSVLQENLLPGTADWILTKPDASKIEGFASRASVANDGEQIQFYVNTASPQFQIDIYRLGWYSGAGARFYVSSGLLPGIVQSPCQFEAASRMTSCSNWQPSFTLTIPSDWISGVYWAKLTESSNGFQSSMIFVVRNDQSTAPFLVQIPFTTYQAYNNWGGKSLYGFNSTDDDGDGIGERAFKVSFDRPFAEPVRPVLLSEYQMIRWLEKEGYDVTYSTSVETHARPELLLRHKAWISLGHDEYWSREMRDNIEAALAQGVHLGFFGGNDAYWQIRLEASPLGVHRVQVSYKEEGRDPFYTGEAGVPQDFSRVTVEFRDFPVFRPENSLLGLMWGDAFNAADKPSDWVAANTDHWVFTGTGMRDGDHIPNIVGYEFDWVHDNGLTPPGLAILSQSPVCNIQGRCDLISNSTIYQAPSGAWVFAAGTIDWGWGLDRFGTWCGSECPDIPNPRLQRITANILGRFQGSLPVLTVSTTALEYSAEAGMPPPPAQTFQITNTGGGSLDWTTSVSGGNWISAEPVTGSAPANVSVTVNPAGLSPGIHRATLRVDALANSNSTNTPRVIDITLRILPAINAGGVVNGASFRGQSPLSPGSIVSLFGTNLAPATSGATAVPVPTTLENTQVLVNGTAAPLFFVSPLQINFQMPWEVTGDTASIAVRTGELTSAAAMVSIDSAVPGIFLAPSISPTAGAVLNQDGSSNTPQTPAQPGSVISIFATGLGPVSPSIRSGEPGAAVEPLNRTAAPVSVLMNGEPAEVLFSGLAPGFVGLYQVNARLPVTLTAGSVEVAIQAGPVLSNSVTVLLEQ